MNRIKGRWKGLGRRIKVGSPCRKNNTVFSQTQMQDFFRDLEQRACMTLNWQYSGFPGRYGYLRLIHKGRQKHTDIFTKADETSLYLQGKTMKLSKNWFSLMHLKVTFGMLITCYTLLKGKRKQLHRSLLRMRLIQRELKKITICCRYCGMKAKEH